MADHGVQCMFVGYALNQPGDCHRMWNPETGKVRKSRDIIWFRRMFYTKQVGTALEVSPMEIDFVETTNAAPAVANQVGGGTAIQNPVVSIEVGEGTNNNQPVAPAAADEDNDEVMNNQDAEEAQEQVGTMRSGRAKNAPQ